MIKTARIGATLLALAVLAAPAFADGLDGVWQATGTAQSRECPGLNVHMTVKGQGFGATIGTAEFTYKFLGHIGADGSFDTKSPGGTAHIAGKFDGDTVTVQFNNDRCPSPRTATGKKTS